MRPRSSVTIGPYALRKHKPDILRAYGRALRSLTRPSMMWHLLWPGLLAFVVWLGVAFYFWADAITAIASLVRNWPTIGDWVKDSSVISAAFTVGANMVLLFLFVPLVSVTSAVIVSTIALPLMLERIANADYADIEERKGGSQTGSVFNSLYALAIFIVLAVLSLPFWLIPGLGLLLPLLLAAWLNQRCYRYDALMNHADRREMRQIIKANRWRLMLLGLGAAAAAFIPIANIVVPAFTGLAFVHFLLEALRHARSEETSQ